MTQSNQSNMSEEIKKQIEEIAQWVVDNRYSGHTPRIHDRELYHTLIDKITNLSHPQPVGDEVVYVRCSAEETEMYESCPSGWWQDDNGYWKPVPLSSLIPARVSEEVKEMEAAEGLIKSLRMEIELDERIHNADLETIKQLRKENDRLQSLIPKHTDSKEQEPK